MNGAGKSTLVRAMAGILPPQPGRVVVHGRVSTLLALGVGFNRNLSGPRERDPRRARRRLTREEMEQRYEKIVRVRRARGVHGTADAGLFVGMYGRLGFSVAVNMDPDILLIDEALSVGDARFRKKSFRKMRRLCKQDKTIVLVSHALNSIRDLSDEVAWIHGGKLQMFGDPAEVVAAFEHFLEIDEDDEDHAALEDV